MDENIPKVPSGNMYEASPDLNNTDMRSIAQQQRGGSLWQGKAAWLCEQIQLSPGSLSLPSSGPAPVIVLEPISLGDTESY